MVRWCDGAMVRWCDGAMSLSALSAVSPLRWCDGQNQMRCLCAPLCLRASAVQLRWIRVIREIRVQNCDVTMVRWCDESICVFCGFPLRCLCVPLCLRASVVQLRWCDGSNQMRWIRVIREIRVQNCDGCDGAMSLSASICAICGFSSAMSLWFNCDGAMTQIKCDGSASSIQIREIRVQKM